jgi:hypothetical protein
MYFLEHELHLDGLDELSALPQSIQTPLFSKQLLHFFVLLFLSLNLEPQAIHTRSNKRISLDAHFKQNPLFDLADLLPPHRTHTLLHDMHFLLAPDFGMN